MNKNIFSKKIFFISLLVVMFLFCFSLVFAALNAPTSTLPVYPMGAVDTIVEACKAVTGSGLIDDYENKCCGGNKLRSSNDPLCKAKSLCDGTKWHSASDPAQLGEVFRIPASAGLQNMPYPIVDINGALVMCVDDKRYDAFRAQRAILDDGEPIGCVPDDTITHSFEGQYLDYLCPNIGGINYYYAGANSVPGKAGLCREDHLVNEGDRLDVSKPGYLFCNSWYGNERTTDLSGMWGHAYLINDAGRSFPFDPDGAFTQTSERCPSAIGAPWLDSSGASLGDVTVIPCPGMVKVDNIEDRSYAGPFGSADERIAGVCLPKLADPNKPVYDIFFNNLNYVRAKINVNVATGVVTPLGTVKGKQYICDTTNRAVAAPVGSTNAKVHICCGTSGCNDIPGTRDVAVTIQHAPGEFITFNDSNSANVMTSNFKVFCKSDGSWGLDLDSDSNACTSASNGQWTGKYCCSEGGDDSALRASFKYFESYVDEGSAKGVCVKSSFKPNSVSLDSSNRVIVSNGLLLGCSGDMWRTSNSGFSLNSGNVKVSSTPVFGPGSSSDSAYSEDFEKSLIVWTGVSSNVYGQFMSQDGTLLGSNFLIASGSFNSARVAYSSVDKKFLVVFGDSSGLRGVYLDATEILDSVSIISGSSCSLGSDSFGGIVYSKALNTFAVSCTKQNGDVAVAVLSANDPIQRDVVGSGLKPSVSASNSKFVVTWSNANSRFVRMADLSSVQLSPVQTISGAGWIFSYYNSRDQRFEVVYGTNTDIFKRYILPNGSLSSEIRINATMNMTVYDVSYVASRNSIFFVFQSDNFAGGLSIAELTSSGVLSRPFDVAAANYTGSIKNPVMNVNPSISDFNGVPLTLMNRLIAANNVVLYSQAGGLGSIVSVNWPNPGNSNSKMNGSLVTYFNTCSKFSVTDGRFCDIDSSWKFTSADNSHFSTVPAELMNHFKSIYPNVTANMQCCLPNQCWDPIKNNGRGACINPQIGSNEYYNLSNGNIFKCVGGVWGNPNGGFKFTPDNCKQGFCSAPGQCLYNPNGVAVNNGNTTANPQCINSGQYIGDDLCLNGSWSSRTVLATNTLLKLVRASDEYSIVCSAVSKDVLVGGLTQNPGNSRNTYCVLDLNPGKPTNQRIVAVTLAQDLEVASEDVPSGSDYIYAIKQSFLMSYPSAKFNSTCVVTEGFGQACAKGESTLQPDINLLKLYYNSTSKIVVFSDKTIDNLKPTWFESTCTSWLPSWLNWLCPSPPSYQTALKNLTFDKIYASRSNNGAIEVLGISKNRCEAIGSTKTQSYLFNYKGYSVSDIQNVIGTPDLYLPAEVTITNGGQGASSSKVSIKNPTNINKDALWVALVSVRK